MDASMVAIFQSLSMIFWGLALIAMIFKYISIRKLSGKKTNVTLDIVTLCFSVITIIFSVFSSSSIVTISSFFLTIVMLIHLAFLSPEST